MTIPFNKFYENDSKAAARVFTEACSGKDQANGFLIDYLNELAVKVSVLDQSIAKSKEKELIAEARELDLEYDGAMGDFRSLIRVKAGIPSMGAEHDAAVKIHNEIERLGGAIEDLPRHSQIEAMDALSHFFATEEGIETLNASQTASLFNSCVEIHEPLKQIEMERGGVRSEESNIPSVTAASKAVNRVNKIIYKHILNYSKIEKEGYDTLLSDIEAKLAPITVLVKARITRGKKSSEETPAEEQGNS